MGGGGWGGYRQLLVSGEAVSLAKDSAPIAVPTLPYWPYPPFPLSKSPDLPPPLSAIYPDPGPWVVCNSSPYSIIFKIHILTRNCCEVSCSFILTRNMSSELRSATFSSSRRKSWSRNWEANCSWSGLSRSMSDLEDRGQKQQLQFSSNLQLSVG